MTKSKTLILIAIIICYAHFSYAATTDTITQHGVTFTFDQEYEYGTFANGDYWVVVDAGDSLVTISSIAPDYQEIDERWCNGWEVNPIVRSTQGFQEGCKGGGFNSGLVPSLPYDASAWDVVVKSVTPDPFDDQPCLKTAVILTVLSEAPPDNGAYVFRPPYLDPDYGWYYTTNIRSENLPSLATPSGATPPSLAAVEGYFDMLNLDHITGTRGRDCRPSDNFPNTSSSYGPAIANHLNSAILRLMLSDSYATKESALIAVLQWLIDLYHIYDQGQTYVGRDGHDGMFLPHLTFFGKMLASEAEQTKIKAFTAPHMKRCLHNTVPTDNTIGLFGCTSELGTESQYWDYWETDPGYNLERPDKYGFIEGGGNVTREINGYQPITYSTYKYGALIARLMNAVDLVNYPRFFGYVERMESSGLHYSPDPCAPVVEGGSRGTEWGPDADDTPYDCILDEDVDYFNSITDWACKDGQECGRMPSRHGERIDPTNSSWMTDFQEYMWDEYYSTGAIALTGTLFSNNDESDVVAGDGLTVIATISGDNFVSGAGSGAVALAIIAGLDGSDSWDTCMSALDADDLTCSTTVCTLDLDNCAGYSISSNDTLEWTFPATATEGGVPIVATPTATIIAEPAAAVPISVTMRDDSGGILVLKDDESGDFNVTLYE